MSLYVSTRVCSYVLVCDQERRGEEDGKQILLGALPNSAGLHP